jgi:hypothetical protein
MRHVLLVIAAAAAIAASAAAAGGGPNDQGQARTWDTALGPVYGPLQAGPPAVPSYGFVSK